MALLLNHTLFCLFKILQIEDPGCFWVIIKGCSQFLEQEVDYQKLNSAMNDFYSSMCQDIEIKPLMLEEGQVCAFLLLPRPTCALISVFKTAFKMHSVLYLADEILSNSYRHLVLVCFVQGRT